MKILSTKHDSKGSRKLNSKLRAPDKIKNTYAHNDVSRFLHVKFLFKTLSGTFFDDGWELSVVVKWATKHFLTRLEFSTQTRVGYNDEVQYLFAMVS